MRTIVGISRDHSASMSRLTNSAMKDYNTNILSIKNASEQTGVQTILNVVRCGVGPAARNMLLGIYDAFHPFKVYKTCAQALLDQSKFNF